MNGHQDDPTRLTFDAHWTYRDLKERGWSVVRPVCRQLPAYEPPEDR